MALEIILLAGLAFAIGLYAIITWFDYQEAIDELKGKNK